MRQNRTIPAKALGQSSHIGIAATTVAFALSQGMSMAEIETVTGVSGEVLGDPDARLDDRIPHQIWTALAAKTQGSVALGIEAARAAPFTALGGLMHGVQYAATLRDALEFISRHGTHLADRLDIRIVTNAGESLVIGQHPNDEIDRGRVAEVGAGLLSRLVREVLGVSTPMSRMEFAYEPLGPEEKYQAFFRCPVHFNQGRTALVFSNEVMA
ncbi:MAG: AraC family transcriptional regulator ligand-binding domain-containing protein, partial [Pseudomonadota bacterium]